MLGAALDPVGTAVATADQSLNSLAQTDTNQLANSSTGDLDRILAENPEASNVEELKTLRGELARQPGVKATRRDDPLTEYRTQHDRRRNRYERIYSDSTILAPLPPLDDVPVGMSDPEIDYPHGVDAPREEGPAYIMDTLQFRFGH